MTAVAAPADHLAVVLLGSPLGRTKGSGPTLLAPSEWARLAGRLESAALTPGMMLELSPEEIARSLDLGMDEADRLFGLLRRAGPAAIELERLADRGIWSMTIVGADYPSRLRSALGPGAPVVLYGAGDQRALSRGGLAVVGSRDASEQRLAMAREIGMAAGRGGLNIISGAARGIDLAVMTGASTAGGSTVGVVADQLERRIRETETRAAIADDTLTLVTPYLPSTRFHVRTAMGRNKVVYGLADAALAAAVTANEGGTWAGAVQALEGGIVPVFVLQDDIERGAELLVERGARRLPWTTVPSTIGPDDIADWIDRSVAAAPTVRSDEQETLFADVEPVPTKPKRKTKGVGSSRRKSGAPPSEVLPGAGLRVSGEEASAASDSGSAPRQDATKTVMGVLDERIERYARFRAVLNEALLALGEAEPVRFAAEADTRRLIDEILDEVGKARSEDKLSALAWALIHTLIGAPTGSSERRRLVDLLVQTTATDLVLLGALAGPAEGVNQAGRDVDAAAIERLVRLRLIHVPDKEAPIAIEPLGVALLSLASAPHTASAEPEAG